MGAGMKVAELDLDPRITAILEEQGITELYPPQAEALPIALAGGNLVLAIPTASGKSLVAYLAILQSVLKGGKALYIVPLRALASEKYADLKAFEPLGIKVAMSVGDYDSVDPNLERQDVLVATSERADSLLRHRTSWLDRLSVVVADEVHLIDEADRGPTLEVTLAKLRQVNPRAQIIALSATIRNSEELAAWLGARHVRSTWRPVPLKEAAYHAGTLHYTDGTSREIADDGDAIAALTNDSLAGGGQCLVFVNTRRSAESVARDLAPVVRRSSEGKKAEALQKLAKELSTDQDEPTSMAARLGKCLQGGTAFHHAGLTNAQRAVVEDGFRKGKVRVIVATPTLASGVNLPARRVIIRDTERFDIEFGNAPLRVLEIKQMVGRAGRPKYDKEGEAVLLARHEDGVEDLLDRYLRAPPEAIDSKLASEAALRKHILASVATEHVRDQGELFGFMGATFFAHLGDVETIRSRIVSVLRFLEKEGFLTAKGDALRPTFFGKRTSDLYIDPLSAVRLRDALKVDRRDEFYFLWAAASTPDMPKLYLRRGDHAWIEVRLVEKEMTFPVDDYEFFLAEVKTASLLQDWLDERTEDETTKVYGIGPGDIRRLVDQGEWLLYSMMELARIFSKPKVPDLFKVVARLRQGIKAELLELASLRGIGRVRARALFTRGYKTLRDLQKAPATDLVRLLGPAVATSVKEQVGQAEAGKRVAGQANLGEFE